MSFFTDIHTALDTRLNLLSGGVVIAWENTEFTPVKDVPWLRPTLLMSPSSLMDLVDLQMNEGIYQIDLFYPTDNGVGTILTKADAIYDHFKADLDLVSNDVTVHIKEIGRAGPARREGGWLMVNVEVHFKCYTN